MAYDELDEIDVKRGWDIEGVDNSLMTILMALGGATPDKHVRLVNLETLKNSWGSDYFSFYGGNRLQRVDEAVLLSDGRIYMIASVYGFAGTFAEEHDQRIDHHILTPKNWKKGNS